MSAAIPDQDRLASGRHTAQQKLRDPDSTLLLEYRDISPVFDRLFHPENPRYIKMAAERTNVSADLVWQITRMFTLRIAARIV
jgi:murein endopeptidase